MDFINAPVGKGLPITKTLKPLIAIPTTAGTGSETTGTAILDITSRSFKTGIANRAMKPVLGIVVCFLILPQSFYGLIHGYRIPTTLNLAQLQYKLAQVSMFCSTAWKVTPPFRMHCSFQLFFSH